MKNKTQNQKPEFQMMIGDDTFFGVCPDCKNCDGSFNIGRDHWFYCREHHVRWSWVSNVLDEWNDENIKMWRANWYDIGKYRECEPHYPDIDNE